MGPSPNIVFDVLAPHPFKVAPAADQDPVQAFTPYGPVAPTMQIVLRVRVL